MEQFMLIENVNEVDYTTMGDQQLIGICGDDAMKWATAFCQTAKKHGNDLYPGWLVGWFANAIETADSVRRHRSLNDVGDAAELVIDEVREELRRAITKHHPMQSAHEGYAVILEELDELWQEVKHGTPENARKEALQVAAMAIRFIIDLRR